MDKAPATLQEAVIHFASYENCHEFMMNLRWPDGMVRCPRCNSENVAYLPNARVFKCYEKHDRQKFSLKVGTIFEDSALGLDKWLPAVWLIANSKNGISSHELGRALGITQKSAWFMLHRIRLAMQTGTFDKLDGAVEVDETYIGGKARNMHTHVRKQKIRGTGMAGKTIVAGVQERGGEIRVSVIENTKQPTLEAHVRKHVADGAAVYTDRLGSYKDLAAMGYAHETIDHAEKYVEGHVHTNGLENFWSLLKRGLNGTYVSVEPFHLFRYLDERAFTFNMRDLTDLGRFTAVLQAVAGRRLTYSALTGRS
jgi:transposase-like protein